MKIIWSENVGRYSETYRGSVGKWHCFTISWNGTRTKNSNEPDYLLHCRLPGIKEEIGAFDMPDAKKRAEKILAGWLKGLEA